jgi:hypothetical protein
MRIILEVKLEHFIHIKKQFPHISQKSLLSGKLKDQFIKIVFVKLNRNIFTITIFINVMVSSKIYYILYNKKAIDEILAFILFFILCLLLKYIFDVTFLHEIYLYIV